MSASEYILGIESSCDECSVAVLHASPSALKVLSVATFSQTELHKPYGGVVPEIASRNHLETILPLLEQALNEAGISATQVHAVTVTNRPGLVGALLVGLSTAKAIAYALDKPLVAVHHLEGHISSLFLDRPQGTGEIGWPMVTAVVSGGHTNLYLLRTGPELWPLDLLPRSLIGRSRDDAAGEAFDKTAKILGFPYPGGVWIDRTAQKGGNPQAFPLPRALPRKDTLDFSFSGFKTQVALTAAKLEKEGQLESRLPDLCASIQEGIVDALLLKIALAIRQHGAQSLAIVGGVAANSRLRGRLETEWKSYGLRQAPLFPAPQYCTDNAAMIAAAGYYRYRQGHALRLPHFLTLNAISNPEV